MLSTIGRCKLFRIKHTILLEGETFLRNQDEIAFFEIKFTFFGRKENTIRLNNLAWVGEKHQQRIVSVGNMGTLEDQWEEN